MVGGQKDDMQKYLCAVLHALAPFFNALYRLFAHCQAFGLTQCGISKFILWTGSRLSGFMHCSWKNFLKKTLQVKASDQNCLISTSCKLQHRENSSNAQSYAITI